MEVAFSLLYVSSTNLNFPDGNKEVDDIVSGSLQRNARLGVTGALISTPSYFAQVLEGPHAAIAELMTSILRDPRHRDLKVVSETDLPKPLFAGWSLAYSGYASYVDRYIEPLFSPMSAPDAARLSRRLIRLMQEFTTLRPPV